MKIPYRSMQNLKKPCISCQSLVSSFVKQLNFAWKPQAFSCSPRRAIHQARALSAAATEEWGDEPDEANEQFMLIEPNEAEEEELLSKEDHEAAKRKTHEYSELGQFRTSPTTVSLPRHTLVEPIMDLLRRTHVKHVRQAAETTMGGRGLPHSPATRRNKNSMYPQLPVGLDASSRTMSDVEADAFLAVVLPFNYATTLSMLTELRKRLGSTWIRSLINARDGQGPRMLDVGTGGAAAVAWGEVVRAEWEAMQESGPDGQARQSETQIPTGGDQPGPAVRKTVVVGSDTLRYRISRFLNDTTFIPRMPDYVHVHDRVEELVGTSSAGLRRKSYDLIIAGNLFMPYSPSVNEKDAHRRGFILENLWSLLNPDGGVLVVFEKGHPRGFEEVADVRHRLLHEFMHTSKDSPEDIGAEGHQKHKTPGRIIAPCTNHTNCPMYKEQGTMPGRRDFCHFKQRFIRPHFLQRLLEGHHRNHEDVSFSYVAVQRGVIPPSDPSPAASQSTVLRALDGYSESETPPVWTQLPRNILQPLKRTGHVIMDVCTPHGRLERWTVPRSFSKQAYHDARKAKWGDLWALGAKTRVPRPARLGRTQSFEQAMLRRVYLVDDVVGDDGKSHMVLPAKVQDMRDKKDKRKKMKPAKYVDTPRTSRLNRKVQFEKEMRKIDLETSTYDKLREKLDKLESGED